MPARATRRSKAEQLVREPHLARAVWEHDTLPNAHREWGYQPSLEYDSKRGWARALQLRATALLAAGPHSSAAGS